MKNIKYYVVTCLILIGYTITSCSKSDDTPEVGIQQLSLPTTLSLAVTNTAQLKPTTSPVNITRPYELRWSSDNEAVATVDQNGKVTAVSAGTANVRTEVYENGEPQKIAAATVVTVKDFMVLLDATSASLEIGGTRTLKPTVTPEGATYTLQWSSSAETIASVDDKGIVTARNVGEAVITVTIKEQPAVKATFSVQVGAGKVNPGAGLGDIENGGTW
ncbi:MAG: Ig-like domain-containing protein [Sphingobacterium sp.]|jgi:uncharacterized protein YjdB|nr:Ig-like domain-containing protein [Sphingobacterium sp.]